MKRAIYEWGVISSAALSAVSIAYFAVSLVTDSADFELSFGDVPGTGMQLRAADGQITVCDHLGNLEVIDSVNKSVAIGPAVVSNLGWNNSVLGARYITFTSDFSVWSLNTSALIPALFFAALGYFSYRRFRTVNLQRRTTTRETAKQRRRPSLAHTKPTSCRVSIT